MSSEKSQRRVTKCPTRSSAHARVHRLGQPGQAVVVAEEEAPHVLEMRGRRRTRGRGARRWRRQLRHRVVRRDGKSGQVGAVVNRREARVAGVERVGDAVGGLERGRPAGQVGQQQRIELDQHRLPLRMRLAGDGHRAEQAVAGRFAHGARDRRAGRGQELRVLGDKLHQVAQAVKFDDVRTQHRAGERIALADALRAVLLQEERPVDLVRSDLQPDLLVLGIDVEEAGLLLGFFDDVREGLLLRGHGGCGGGCRGRGDARHASRPGRRGLGCAVAGTGDRRGVVRGGARRVGCGDRGGGERRRIGRGNGGAASQQRSDGERERDSGTGCESCGQHGVVSRFECVDRGAGANLAARRGQAAASSPRSECARAAVIRMSA